MQPQKQVIFLMITFFSITFYGFSQDKKIDSLQAIVSEIAASNVYEVSYSVGFTGAISQQYRRFKQLISLATAQQLSDLAFHHWNAVVRLYALQSLRHCRLPISTSLVEQFRNDQVVVLTLEGCNGATSTVSQLANRPLAWGSIPPR